MTEAPERLAPEMANWTEDGGMQSAGPYTPFNGEIAEYYRADLCADPALLVEAVEVLRECHDALRDHGKQYPHMVKGYTLDAENRARAFLAKLENRHDR